MTRQRRTLPALFQNINCLSVSIRSADQFIEIHCKRITRPAAKLTTKRNTIPQSVQPLHSERDNIPRSATKLNGIAEALKKPCGKSNRQRRTLTIKRETIRCLSISNRSTERIIETHCKTMTRRTAHSHHTTHGIKKQAVSSAPTACYILNPTARHLKLPLRISKAANQRIAPFDFTRPPPLKEYSPR